MLIAVLVVMPARLSSPLGSQFPAPRATRGKKRPQVPGKLSSAPLYREGTPGFAVHRKNQAALSCTSQTAAFLRDAARGKSAEIAIAVNIGRPRLARSDS